RTHLLCQLLIKESRCIWVQNRICKSRPDDHFLVGTDEIIEALGVNSQSRRETSIEKVDNGCVHITAIIKDRARHKIDVGIVVPQIVKDTIDQGPIVGPLRTRWANRSPWLIGGGEGCGGR